MSKYNRFVGLPFKEKGRTFEGVDCWGLLRLFYKEIFNIVLPSYHENYQTAFDEKEISQLINNKKTDWYPVQYNDINFGDGVLLRLKGEPMHIGIVLRKNKMLHVTEKTNSVVENYSGLIWRKRIIGFFRHKLLMKDI